MLGIVPLEVNNRSDHAPHDLGTRHDQGIPRSSEDYRALASIPRFRNLLVYLLAGLGASLHGESQSWSIGIR